MKVISILNQKGGVGKTTSTYNIAAALSKKGKRILMIDSDSQASLTLMGGNNPLTLEHNLPSLYAGDDISNCIYKTTIDNLYLLPSSLELAKVEVTLIAVTFGRELIIKNALEKLSDSFDFVIIDCCPSLGLININNLVASDYVIVPTELSLLSCYALDDLKDTIKQVSVVNKKLKILGLIATKFDKRIKKDNEILESLIKDENVIGVIKNSVDAKKGIEEGIPAIIFNEYCEVSQSYMKIADYIEKECL